MSRTTVTLLNNFRTVYSNPIPYIPRQQQQQQEQQPVTKTLRLLLFEAPPLPIPSTFTGGATGPIGPTGPTIRKYSSLATISSFDNINHIAMLETGLGLAYINGTPVYVSSAEIYTNNFQGTVLAYDPSTGYMTIGNIVNVHGTISTTDTYTLNLQELTNVGPQGGVGPMGEMGYIGIRGPTGATGPQVPFSGGNAALIGMFQYGFDCGDVE